MGDNTQICRLCLDAVPAGDGQAIEEIEKEMLQVLLINIDFNMTENAVACSRCLKTLRDCFDFKSTCVCEDDYITLSVNSDVTVDNKKVFKKEIVSNDNVNMENFQACRVCMSVIEEEGLNYAIDTDSKVGVLKDFNTAYELSVCKKCLSNTKKYNEFRKTCHQVEQRIKNYFHMVQDCGITNRINLDDILKLNNAITKPEAVKEECSDVEIADVKLIYPENRDIVSTKCEEIHIKDEIDIGVETEDFDEGDCYSPGNSGPSKETPLRNKKTKTKYKGLLKAHQKEKHQENQEMLYKCNWCSFSTKYKKSVVVHQVLHKDPQEIPKYKCEMCIFETKYKNQLTSHMLTHGDPKVVNKYKCEKCPFRTKWHCNLKMHIITHSSEYPHSCDECNYSSKHKSSLRLHKRIHQKNWEARYKCKLCSYQTECSKSIKAHTIRTHTDPSEVPNFKCAHCPYETALKWRLIEHIRRMHGSETQPMIKCELCLYVTTEKANLRKHSFVHQEATIQCNQCNYRTKQKHRLQLHMQRHEPGSLSSSKQLIFKCDQCEFSAHKKASVNRHQLKHMELGEAMVYYCAICDFKTKYKKNLEGHLKGCLKRKKRKENDDAKEEIKIESDGPATKM